MPLVARVLLQTPALLENKMSLVILQKLFQPLTTERQDSLTLRLWHVWNASQKRPMFLNIYEYHMAKFEKSYDSFSQFFSLYAYI